MIRIRSSLLWLCLVTLVLVGSMGESFLPGGRLVADEPVREGRAGFRIAGYLPDYRVEEFDAEAAGRLTDLILFSAEPNAAGELSLGRLEKAPWEKLRQFKTRQRVRLILCVGGWERSAAFAAASQSQEARKKFARSAVRICLAQRLDGLDLDWEHPKNEAEQIGYAKLLAELHDAFRPHGLTLSLTMAAWQVLPAEAFAAVDAVQVMAYDHEGRHSTLEGAKRDVQSLLDRGIRASKIVLGLPFYGRNLKNKEQALTYAEILRQHRPAADVDEVAGVYFNGPQTIAEKTRFALEQGLGGVMAWELGQDAAGGESLLKVIEQTVRSRQERK